MTRAQAQRVHAALQAGRSRHVTVVAASGDIGAVGEPCATSTRHWPASASFTPVKEVNLPAADPLVLGAAWTTLTASHATGAWQGETAWGLPYSSGANFQASGGGFQLACSPGRATTDMSSAVGAARGVPDAAVDANGHTGMAAERCNGGWSMLRDGGGTSASAPAWAAVIALADQYAGRPLGFVNPAIYQIARGPRLPPGLPRRHHR